MMARKGLLGGENDRRTMSIHLRCTREEYDIFVDAAKESGYSMNSFIRSFVHSPELVKLAIETLKENRE